MDAYERQRRLEEHRRKQGLPQGENPIPPQEDDDSDELVSRETAEKLAKAKDLAKVGALNAWKLTREAAHKAKEQAAVVSEKTRQKVKAIERSKVKDDLPSVVTVEEAPSPQAMVPDVEGPDDEPMGNDHVLSLDGDSRDEFPSVDEAEKSSTAKASVAGTVGNTKRFAPSAKAMKWLVGVGAVVALVAVAAFFFAGKETTPDQKPAPTLTQGPVVPTPYIEPSVQVPPEAEQETVVSEPVTPPPVVKPVVAQEKAPEVALVVEEVKAPSKPKPQAKAEGSPRQAEAAKKAKPATQENPQQDEEAWQDKAMRDIDAWSDKL